MDRFGHLSKNLVVIGDKRLTVCYLKHSMPGYTTGLPTVTYKWPEFLEFVEETLKKHCSIGATIRVYHHQGEYLGEVCKQKGPNAIFVPLGIESVNPGAKLPHNWRIHPSEEEVEAVKLTGWLNVKSKLTKMFNVKAEEEFNKQLKREAIKSEKERIRAEKALEKERIKTVKALEKAIEKEKMKAVKAQEKERIRAAKALEKENLKMAKAMEKIKKRSMKVLEKA